MFFALLLSFRQRLASVCISESAQCVGPRSDCTAKVVHRYHCLNEVSSNCRQTADERRSTGVEGDTVIYVKHTADGTVFGSGRPALQGRQYSLRQRTARPSRQAVLSSAADGPPFKAGGTLFGSGRLALQGRRYSLRQRTARSSRHTVRSSTGNGSGRHAV